MIWYWLNHTGMWDLRQICNFSSLGEYIIYCHFMELLFKITVGHQASTRLSWADLLPCLQFSMFVGEIR